MDRSLREVVEAVRAKTKRDQQTWEPFGPDGYRTRVGSGTIELGRVAEPEGESVPPAYVVSVYDRLGQTAATAEVAADTGGADFAAVEALYLAAQRATLRPQRVLDEMLQLLRG